MQIVTHKLARTGPVALMCAIASTVALLATTAGGAHGKESVSPITVTVPVSAVRAGGASLSPKGAAGDLFEESYAPKSEGAIERQDLFGAGTFQGRGIFLGTVNLAKGQIVYAGSTTDQDDNAFAVLGGTGKYVGAHGLLITKALSRTKVRITIELS